MGFVFIPPYRSFDPPVAADTPEWQLAPAIYFTDLIPVGVNVWVTKTGQVTETQPADPNTWDYCFYGGHVWPVNASQIAMLTAAGYAAYIFSDTAPLPPPVVVTPPPVTSGGDSPTYGEGTYGEGVYGQ